MNELLIGLTGALVGGVASAFGGMFTKRLELRRARRVRLYDQQLPAIERAAFRLRDQIAATSELLTDRAICDDLEDILRSAELLGAASPHDRWNLQATLGSLETALLDAVGVSPGTVEHRDLLDAQKRELDMVADVASEYSTALERQLRGERRLHRAMRRVQYWFFEQRLRRIEHRGDVARASDNRMI